MKTTRSEKLFKEACELIPGGVNSPVRACLGVGADPLFIASAKGSHVTTVDGQEMIDFVESWGPMLLGHSHPEVTKAVVAVFRPGAFFLPFCSGLCSSFLCFRFCHRLFVLFQDNGLNFFSGSGVDRMCDIAVLPVRSLTARHCDEQSFFSFDYLNIMYDKFVIDCDRHNRLHFSFFCYLAYSHVCNVHKLLCPFHPIIRWRIFRFFRQQF